MTETFTHDNLFAGHVQPVVAGAETITAGSYTRGTVLGRISASDKCQICDSAAVDGSGDIYAILAEDTDASSGDVVAPVWYTGEFNKSALTFGGTDTAATRKQDARNVGIFFKDTVPA